MNRKEITMKMKKIISILLCVTLILCTLAPLAHAQSDECNCGETPLIYVGPLGSTSIYLNPDTDEEVQLFRLTTDTVLKLVGGILPALVLLGITRNYDAFGDSVIKVINETMGMLALDGDGNSFENVSAKREMPTGTEHGKGTDYYFSYDWRLSPIEVAGQLKEFVEEVKRLTGHDTVNFKASSMGGVVTMSYFYKYGYSDVEACVFQCCPLQGTSLAGELLCRQITFNARALYEYGIQAYPPVDFEGVLLNTLFDFIYYSGLADAVLGVGDKLLEELHDKIFEELLTPVFGTILGLWSFVPDCYYEEARAINLDPKTQAGLIAKADEYHYQVQQRADEILTGAVESGMRVMIVAGYNIRTTPILPDTMDCHSDCTVDTCYASAGATVCDIYETFPEGYVQAVNDGHNHVSPDGAIDASTCILPEYTWFIKDMLHSNGQPGIDGLYDNVLYPENDEPFTVWSDPNYTQFLQNDKPNSRVIPMGNFAPGAEAPEIEEGKAFYDFFKKWIAPVENTVFKVLDFVRGE